MKKEKCEAETESDCFDCGKMYSTHSLHYSSMYNRKVVEISCTIGGHRVFDETGMRIN